MWGRNYYKKSKSFVGKDAVGSCICPAAPKTPDPIWGQVFFAKNGERAYGGGSVKKCLTKLGSCAYSVGVGGIGIGLLLLKCICSEEGDAK